ncbi:MAG: FCD domain-containing protein, partial [Anaerovoracaceae bacterium]
SSYQVYVRHDKNTVAEDEDYLPTVLEEHRRIFQAFKDKDVEAGAEAMAAHMDSSRNRHKKTMGR